MFYVRSHSTHQAVIELREAVLRNTHAVLLSKRTGTKKITTTDSWSDENTEGEDYSQNLALMSYAELQSLGTSKPWYIVSASSSVCLAWDAVVLLLGEPTNSSREKS
jgi:hypothetical protein